MRALPARADHLINHRTVDFEARARQTTGGAAVDLILDASGVDSLKKGYQLVVPAGRLAVFRASSAATGRTGATSAMLSMLTSASSLRFNPLSLMNGNKGASSSSLGHVDVIRLQSDTGSDESGLSATLCDFVSPIMKV
jgi:NADPH:quinone reductase-like Zn-dependent oxidoreductase